MDELEQKLLNDPVFQHILKFAPESQRELMTYELARYIFNITLQLQKITLEQDLARVIMGTNHCNDSLEGK